MKKHLMTAAATAGLFVTALGASASAAENTYMVKPGDSLWRISQLNNVSIEQLKTWNHLLSDTIYADQTLSIQPAVKQASNTAGDATYTVKSRYPLGNCQVLRNHCK